jgi:hypothetical protein
MTTAARSRVPEAPLMRLAGLCAVILLVILLILPH